MEFCISVSKLKVLCKHEKVISSSLHAINTRILYCNWLFLLSTTRTVSESQDCPQTFPYMRTEVSKERLKQLGLDFVDVDYAYDLD